MISTYKRIFHEKFDPHSPDFEKQKSKSQDFNDKFLQIAKNIEVFCFFLYFNIQYIAKFD
jgi:hypothetical protein